MDFYLYDEISDAPLIELKNFLEKAKLKPVTVHINSGGGEVFSGLAMCSLLRQYKGEVTVQIDGLCGSAATLVMCGGDKIIAAENALVMIHLPSVFLMDSYNAEDLQKIQNALAAIKESIITTYSKRLKLESTEIEKLLKAEKWYTAAEAIEINLIDGISAPQKFLNKAGIKMSETQVTNELMLESYKNSVLQMERQRITALNAAKSDNPYANAILEVAMGKGHTLSEVTAYIDAVKAVPVQANNNFDELIKAIKDNVQSGAAEVQGEPAEVQKDNSADMIASFANKLIGVNA